MIINNVVHGAPAHNVPAHLSYGQYVIDKLREYCTGGDEIALINGDTGEQFTFKQILDEIIYVATGLKTIGAKRGDVVALCSENRIEYIATAVGAACCGVVVTTVNTMYTKDELIHVLNLSKPKIIFCSKATLNKQHGIFKMLPYVQKIVQFDESPVEEGILLYRNIIVKDVNVHEYEAEAVLGQIDTVFILYSSGTTGLPKGVMLTHLNVVYYAHNFTTDDSNENRMLTIVPWFHAYGLIGTINYMTAKKLQVYLFGFNPERYLSTIQEYKINILLTVPPIVIFFCKSLLTEKYDLSSVTTVWCAAAPLSQATVNEAMKRLPNCKGILQAYGMTETCTAATKDSEDDGAKRVKRGSGGFPIPGIKAKVVDIDTRKKLGPNHKGEICLKGPTVMKGYVGDESATREAIDDEGYIKTGDIGYYDEDGYFFIVDRLKEIIKYKGFQVPPAEVENVILQHPAVAECGVVGALDELAGELPTAFVVKKPATNVTAREIIEFTNNKLSAAKHLRGGVIFLNEIPKNPSGKILRRVLKHKLQENSKSKL